jgi:hypothetical protein
MSKNLKDQKIGSVYSELSNLLAPHDLVPVLIPAQNLYWLAFLSEYAQETLRTLSDVQQQMIIEATSELINPSENLKGASIRGKQIVEYAHIMENLQRVLPIPHLQNFSQNYQAPVTDKTLSKYLNSFEQLVTTETLEPAYG